tara:strand:- start:90 stop:428 length:339 start_codon:yes stop_codon:yes gene_type:complete
VATKIVKIAATTMQTSKLVFCSTLKFIPPNGFGAKIIKRWEARAKWNFIGLAANEWAVTVLQVTVTGKPPVLECAVKTTIATITEGDIFNKGQGSGFARKGGEKTIAIGRME